MSIFGSVAGAIYNAGKSVFSGVWTWQEIAEQNRKVLGGFFNILYYLKRQDRIEYWKNTITSAKGKGIDGPGGHTRQIHTEVGNYAHQAGITANPGMVDFTGLAQQLYLEGTNYPVDASGNWSPGPLAQQGQAVSPTQPGAAQGSFILPVLIAVTGGIILFLVLRR